MPSAQLLCLLHCRCPRLPFCAGAGNVVQLCNARIGVAPKAADRRIFVYVNNDVTVARPGGHRLQHVRQDHFAYENGCSDVSLPAQPSTSQICLGASAP